MSSLSMAPLQQSMAAQQLTAEHTIRTYEWSASDSGLDLVLICRQESRPGVEVKSRWVECVHTYHRICHSSRSTATMAEWQKGRVELKWSFSPSPLRNDNSKRTSHCLTASHKTRKRGTEHRERGTGEIVLGIPDNLLNPLVSLGKPQQHHIDMPQKMLAQLENVMKMQPKVATKNRSKQRGAKRRPQGR